MPSTKCKVCSRPLSDPLSIAIGIGPECRGSKSKRHRKLIARTQRAEAFAKREPLVFVERSYLPIAGGAWKDSKTDQIFSAPKMLEWLIRSDLVDQKVVEAFKMERAGG